MREREKGALNNARREGSPLSRNLRSHQEELVRPSLPRFADEISPGGGDDDEVDKISRGEEDDEGALEREKVQPRGRARTGVQNCKGVSLIKSRLYPPLFPRQET